MVWSVKSDKAGCTVFIIWSFVFGSLPARQTTNLKSKRSDFDFGQMHFLLKVSEVKRGISSSFRLVSRGLSRIGLLPVLGRSYTLEGQGDTRVMMSDHLFDQPS